MAKVGIALLTSVLTSYIPDYSLINRVVYQLQNADPYEIVSQGFNVAIIDYSRDGTEAGKYSVQEISFMSDNGVIPLAYLSIGEAEDYRFYWDDQWNISPPHWLGKENPDWPGNYAVKYWEEEWQNIILTYLNKIIFQGFSGVYLDKIDSFYYWSDPNNGEGFYIDESEAAGEMIKFIKTIADYARNLNPNFIVVPQNGEEILYYDYNGSLLNTISGWGVEDLFYYETIPVNQSLVDRRINWLTLIKESGKFIFVTDYVDDSTVSPENTTRILEFRNKALSYGFIPFIAKTDRALDEINFLPFIQPSNYQKYEVAP